MQRTVLVLCLSFLALATAEAGRRNEVKVLYWNIQNGMWSDQQDNYDNFVGYVRSLAPDVCVWCEARSLYVSSSTKKLSAYERYLPSNWDDLAARYGHGHVYVGADVDGYPQVITSRFPIRNVRRITGHLPDSSVVHGASWARISVNGKDLNIVTLHHYPHSFARGISRKDTSAVNRSKAQFGGERYRLKEIETICRETVLSSPDADRKLWMMLGDFNSISRRDNNYYQLPEDSPAFLVHDFIAHNTIYRDALADFHPGKFLPTAASGRRIDFIYVSPRLYDMIVDISVTEAWEKRTSAGMSNFCHPSDHLPIVVRYRF